MVRKYGPSAKCWSNFFHLCLSNETFCVPTTVEKSPEKQKLFKNNLASKVKLMISSTTLTRSVKTTTTVPSPRMVAPVQRESTVVGPSVNSTSHTRFSPSPSFVPSLNVPKGSQVSARTKRSIPIIPNSIHSVAKTNTAMLSRPASSHLVSTTPNISAQVSPSKPLSESNVASNKVGKTVIQPSKKEVQVKAPTGVQTTNHRYCDNSGAHRNAHRNARVSRGIFFYNWLTVNHQ